MYGCNRCTRKFSRRWNARRHNSLVRDDSALILDRNGEILNKDNSPNLDSTAENHQQLQEQKIRNFCVRMIKPIDKLETLVNIRSPVERQKYFSSVITYSLSQANPINYIEDLIDNAYSNLWLNRLINYVAVGNNINYQGARILLENLITNNESFDT
ncbi:hypothetical protein [Candidatus Nitrosocosmicus arcticus]|uniref:Uncharacterized protein n=1 Tax=Candidatus Nitrosocosmicus arcticus TaxID=2035267 RepID=A0A557SUX0_9ARCH|nr:hypothetical protein [Candidatus Nitrosocosmicus arcticus]TVP40398.1 hypothetical protein NARC_80128 [Candidatus Nitrosocosmicus arcticus]